MGLPFGYAIWQVQVTREVDDSDGNMVDILHF
jgi:hypothetical protein